MGRVSIGDGDHVTEAGSYVISTYEVKINILLLLQKFF